MNFTIRKIAREEFDDLYRLFPDDDQLWREYRRMRLQEFDNGEIDVYVIEKNNIFIGELSANYISHDLASEAIPGQRAYLQTFRLDKTYQGAGLGQRLIQFVLSDLELEGYTEFTIGVEDDNARAKHIYFKFGFTEAIDKGRGDKFDPSEYTLYMRSVRDNG